MAATDSCVFCGASPTTIEDLLPKWIRRYLGNRATVSVLGDTGRGTTRTFKGLAYVWKAKVVCKKCNGGWMCDLETAASPILKRMFDEKLAISFAAGPNDSRRLVAQWVLKTALMLQYVDPDPAIPLAVYHDFFATREPPAHSLIFLARHEVQKTPSGVVSVSSELTPTDPTVHFRGDLYGVTFFVKNVVMQLVGYVGDVPAGVGIYLNFPQTFAVYVQRLWPAGTLLEWTPPHSLDDAQLARFMGETQDIRSTWSEAPKSTP
jgi:hypothetical protein